jgi:hypothetical protein
MLAGLDAEIQAREAVFEPEGGAYGHHHHSHGRPRALPAHGLVLAGLPDRRPCPYSHGLETAVVSGLVRSGDELATWLEDVLRYCSGFSAALFLGRA